MKNLSLLIVILVLLFAGGALTTMFSGGGSSGLISPIQQTEDPAASTMQAESWQAEQLFLLVVFVVLTVGGIGFGTAIVMWYLHREISEVKAMPVGSQTEALGAKESGERHDFPVGGYRLSCIYRVHKYAQMMIFCAVFCEASSCMRSQHRRAVILRGYLPILPLL